MKITLPPITPGEWGTDRRFPATVIAGTPDETSRGLMVSAVCRVQGQVLPAYKHDLKAIASVPDLLATLAMDAECLAACRKFMGERPTGDALQYPNGMASAMVIDALEIAMERNRAALLKAGATITE
jgi:hypothetical protein